MNNEIWGLSGAKVRELRIIIQTAFKERELKRLLREELDFYWDSEVGGDTYVDKISDLLSIIESRGIKIYRNLVFSIAAEISSNDKIEEFAKSNIGELIENNVENLSDRHLLDLIAIFEQVNNFNEILASAKSVLPPSFAVHVPKDMEYIESSKIATWFKYFILFRILLESYPSLSGQPSILEFVCKLISRGGFSDRTKDDLDALLLAVRPSPIPLKQEDEASLWHGELKAHLMIVVKTESSQYRVIATLLYIGPNADRKRSRVDLDPQSDARGILCNKTQLKKKLIELIDKCNSDILIRLDSMSGCSCSNVFVELFLPVNLMIEPFDRHEFIDRVHLAARYPLAIRSSERFLGQGESQETRLKLIFRNSGKRIKKLLEEDSNLNPKDLIQPFTDRDLANFHSFKEKLKRSIGLKSKYQLPACKKKKAELLLGILETGIPMMLWSRCGDTTQPDAIAGIDRFLTIELLRDRYKFLEEVRSARACALDHRGTPENRWLRHLTVLWDDPELMPIEEKPLQEGAKTPS